VDRDALFDRITAASPAPGDILYVERRGEEYAFVVSNPDQAWQAVGPEGFPDVWIYWSGEWPAGDTARQRAVFDDLLAEMESMAGGSDRCRWPLDEPWPHRH
jgi:hypothetical protein